MIMPVCSRLTCLVRFLLLYLNDTTVRVKRHVYSGTVVTVVSILVSSAVELLFEPRSGQSKEYCKIGVFCFPAKHDTLRRKVNNLLARNQDNVFL
jgi:hypothetical protein